MKKTFLYVIVLATVTVAAFSCVRLLDTPQPIKGDHSVIRLTPVVDGPVTKANTEAGDDTYNENLISNYYWFIYSDEAGSTLKCSGYVSGDASTEILLDEAFPNGGTGYVYVVANLPAKPANPVEGDEWLEYNATTKNYLHMVQGESGATASDCTFANLKTLSFGKDMPTTYTNKSEFYEYTSATTGLPKPDRFVMRTEAPVEFDLVEKSVVPVTAKLKRVAAKIILELHVAKEVRQMKTNSTTDQEEYVKTWTSDMSHVQIYMLWGSTHGDLNGTKFTYSNEHQNWFYSASPRYAMFDNPPGGVFANGAIQGSVTDGRFAAEQYLVNTTVWDYVYQVDPSQGDNGWKWKEGVSSEDKVEDNRGNYYYGDWAYVDNDGKPVVIDPETNNPMKQRTTQTAQKPYWAISSRPLYTMPISWNVNDAHAPFIKIIIPWKGSYEENVGGHQAGDVDSKATEFYYKILVPKRTTLDANNCYHISLDISVLGSEADDVPVALSGEYHVVDWNSPQAMGGDQSAGRYLNCATSFEFYSQNEMNIPVHSSHEIEIVGTPTATYQNYSSTTVSPGSLSYSTSSSSNNNFTVTTVGNSKVIVNHIMETNLDDMESYDVSPITYTFTIQHKGDGGSAYQKTITVTQYPSLYIKNELSPTAGTGYDYDYGYYSAGYVYINNQQSTSTNSTNNWKYVANIVYLNNSGNPSTRYTNNNPNMYVITTTVMDPSLPYVLGDPRKDVVDNTSFSFESAPAKYGTTPRRGPLFYYPTDRLAEGSDQTQSRTYNMVAPSFRIASSYGKCYGDDSYEAMARRCEAYQEAGYPAGRWRVPTKGELEYITTLSAKGLIPSLFNVVGSGSASIYMSAHGVKQINADGTVSDLNQTTGWVRCVYDEWYWGTDKVANNTFTWGDKQR